MLNSLETRKYVVCSNLIWKCRKLVYAHYLYVDQLDVARGCSFASLTSRGPIMG